MTNSLKAKHTFYCDTCGCDIKRVKTIKVTSTNKEDAKTEANEQLKEWFKINKNKDCRFCASIKKDLAE